ncbi:hypothetical protein TIFTF001_035753 [Ficus carica]|uniref:Uncharacterized protein n=1 Tax=Ficus carica TaxID=3494 RepID=A0AA88E261_FICCA|nr:hypothetical protein TIFTF001_035753 [Ficus carica]
MGLWRDRRDGSLIWFCWCFVANMVGFVTVFGDGVAFFPATELKSPMMGNGSSGGKGHEK